MRRNGTASAIALADFAGWLSLVTGSLGKFGQDVALMAQAGDEIELSGGGGSSAMPHKQNPVEAEVLVTLARFNAAQLSGMHQALVHEQERSGAAWTLEWLILPQMVVATAAALRLAGELAGQIESLGGLVMRKESARRSSIIGSGPSGLLLGSCWPASASRTSSSSVSSRDSCAWPRARRRAGAGHCRACWTRPARRRGCMPRVCRMTASRLLSTAACTASI